MKKNNLRSVSDTHLIEVEYYNPNKFDIIFERDQRYFDYIRLNNISLGPVRAVLKADDFLTLPHQYYIPKAINGPEIFNLIINMGDQKRKGNKLPSIPIMESR